MILSILRKDQLINIFSNYYAKYLSQHNPNRHYIIKYHKNTFTNKDLIAFVNTHYYAVKFNAEGNDTVHYKEQVFGNPNYDPKKAKRRNSSHQFSQYLGVRAYPTIVFLGQKGEVIAPIPGYQTAQKLELYLQLFKDETYKKMNNQEAFNAYYKTFKPSFAP